MIERMESKSELYNTLVDLGAVCTEDHLFREARADFNAQFIKYYDLSYDDVRTPEGRFSYLHPHIRFDVWETGIFEIWVDGEYINNAEITWVQGTVHMYAVLPKDYDVEKVKAKVVRNDYAIDRYSKIQEVEGHYQHVFRINLFDPPYNTMDHPELAVYYVGDGKIQLPQVTKSGDIMTFTCKYTKSIDMIVCSNLIGIYQLEAGIGKYIDNVYSTVCYLHIVVEEDPDYPIDARFYPCIKADKDCTIRVFGDATKTIPHPELTRIMTYPEFVGIADPYNTNDEYISKLEPVETMILASDDDETILKKFEDIAPYCYRIYEDFPKFCNEQSDFLVLDNTDFGKQNFSWKIVKYQNGASKTAIICRCPYEDYRDILWYGNYMFHDYEVINAVKIPPNRIVEAEYGTPTYVITGDYKPELFTLMKFNAAEDTMISNIGDFIDTDNLLLLHTRLNRFYRNLMILRGSVMDVTEPFHKSNDDFNQVRVSSNEPGVRDTHLWFELLVNAVPEKFGKNPNLIIKSFGLDVSDFPEELREGIYSLNLPEDAGPEVYTELLFTFFDLAERHENRLIAQHRPGDPGDPRHSMHDHLYHGPIDMDAEGHEVNTLHIDNPALDKVERIDKVEEGFDVIPNDGKEREEGRLYVGANPGFGDFVPSKPSGGDEVDPDISGVLDGVFADEDRYSLDTIEYYDPDTGRILDGGLLRQFSVEEKISMITKFITEGTEDEKEHTKLLWEQYLSSMDEEVLDIAVYKVLMTEFAYNAGWNHTKPDVGEDEDFDMKELPYVVQMEEPENPTTGLYWVQLDSDDPLVIHETKVQNLKYILSLSQPDEAEIGTFWINIPAVVLQEYIEEILSMPLLECGAVLPVGHYARNVDREDEATVVIDYGAHGVTDGGAPLFNEVKDDSLHRVFYGDEIFAHEPEDGDIWYEFLDEIDNKVCYSDTTTMVIRIDERLMLIEFEHDNMTAFAFDDIVLNFKGRLGIKYIAILADLINSRVIKLDDVNIFYRRLLTGIDHFEPGLRRLYTGRSYVISTAKIDTLDYAVTYSTNIGRYHIDYTDKEHVINRERESIYRNVIDYSYRDVAFIQDRMILFVNGRYIPRDEYEEIAAGKIQLKNFHEIIDFVDILYSKKDESLAKLKRIAIAHWGAPDTSTSIQRPKKNKIRHMRPIIMHEHTLMGYYDVLIHDYIFNGKLERTIHYISEHPEEKDQIINDFKRKFHKISDFDLVGMDFEESRIIIPALGSRFKYEIKEESQDDEGTSEP